MTKVPITKITLVYVCPKCGKKELQPLTDVPEVGPCFCADCERGMVLQRLAQVEI